jgi:hypothetical protein
MGSVSLGNGRHCEFGRRLRMILIGIRNDELIKMRVVNRSSMQKGRWQKIQFFRPDADQKVANGIKRQVARTSKPSVDNFRGLSDTASELCLIQAVFFFRQEPPEKEIEHATAQALLEIGTLCRRDWRAIVTRCKFIQELSLRGTHSGNLR